jgi:hypothetical protein
VLDSLDCFFDPVLGDMPEPTPNVHAVPRSSTASSKLASNAAIPRVNWFNSV